MAEETPPAGDGTTADKAFDQAIELVEQQLAALGDGRRAFLSRPAVREVYDAAGKTQPA